MAPKDQVVLRVEGDDVYAKLKFESGGHRVQRVPATETQGRVHSSACTVALAEPAAAVGLVHRTRRMTGSWALGDATTPLPLQGCSTSWSWTSPPLLRSPPAQPLSSQ